MRSPGREPVLSTAVAIRTRPEQRSTPRAQVRTQLRHAIGWAAVADVVSVSTAVLLAFFLKFTASNPPPATLDQPASWLAAFGWVVPVWLASLALADAYSQRQFARGTDESKTVLRGSVWAAAAVAMISYLVNNEMSRGFYLYAFVLGTAFLMLERYAIRLVVYRLRDRDQLLHRVVAVGSRESVAEMVRVMRHHRGLGYTLAAACLSDSGGETSFLGAPVLGCPEGAVDACETVGADTLLVAGGTFSSFADLRQIGWQLQDRDIDLVVAPNLVDVAGPRIHMRPVAGLPLIHIDRPQAAAAMKWGKALFDRAGALLLVALLSPVMLAVAVAIKLDGHGPVLFGHDRVGVRGDTFRLWKFRSMVADASARHDALVDAAGASALLFKLERDPRVTRVGAFIRRFSLDELPQLFNVLRGEMSLVGPRPQVAAEVAAYGEHHHRRLLVRPGMTGLWQVSGRSELDWDEAVRLDLYYVDNWSMMGDLVILAKTFKAVVAPQGAY
jgi:exopolysaccharide biosynthesis polyprenyl glycosylphosphotransferase